LDETKPEVPIFLSRTRSPKETRRGPGRQPHQVVARPPLGRAATWCGPLGRPPTSPFRLYIAPDAKTLNQSASTHELQPPKATFLPPPWIPSPWGRAPKKPWRKGAKGRRSPMMPAAGKELPAPPPCAPRCPLHRLHRHLHHQLLLVYSGSSSHTPLYRPM